MDNINRRKMLCEDSPGGPLVGKAARRTPSLVLLRHISKQMHSVAHFMFGLRAYACCEHPGFPASIAQLKGFFMYDSLYAARRVAEMRETNHERFHDCPAIVLLSTIPERKEKKGPP